MPALPACGNVRERAHCSYGHGIFNINQRQVGRIRDDEGRPQFGDGSLRPCARWEGRSDYDRRRSSRCQVNSEHKEVEFDGS